MNKMGKPILSLTAFLLLASAAFADTYRVHYSIRGSGRDITVQAKSSSEARRTRHGHVSWRRRDRRAPGEVGGCGVAVQRKL